MLRFLWRRFIADRLALSLSARMAPQLDSRIASALAAQFSSVPREDVAGLERPQALRDDCSLSAVAGGTAGSPEIHTIVINGRQLRFSGEPTDPYFSNLPIFANGNKQLKHVLRQIPDGAVCLDIGANIGLTSLIMATSLPQSQIYAFEPSPSNISYLSNNIQLNRSENVHIVRSAVGDTDSTLAITQPASGAHTSVIRDRLAAHPAVEVSAVSLDTWSAATGLQGIGFIKIDVEGYEARVLIGAAETIARYRMPILMEFNSVTISFESRQSPWMFAQDLASVFEMSIAEEDGQLDRIDGDRLYGFVLTNMTEHGCIDDVILRAKAGVSAADIRAALASSAGI